MEVKSALRIAQEVVASAELVGAAAVVLDLEDRV
jgi:hypothetical protein